MKQIIDIETWERRDNYNFFRNFVSSWYSITTEIDCTEASLAARAAGRSFFLYYLYAVLRSANEVDELRFRKDKNGQVVFHDRVDIISPIAVPGKTFYTIRIPYHEDFNRFLCRSLCFDYQYSRRWRSLWSREASRAARRLRCSAFERCP